MAMHQNYDGLFRSVFSSLDDDQKATLFDLQKAGKTKIGNTSVVIRPNYGKIDLKLFVGQIPKEWDEQMVTEFFSGYGEILESQIIRDGKSGQSKGCAFVKFASMTKAEEAKHLIESKHITLPGVNNVIQIRWADGEDARLGVDENTIPKLFVGSIPRSATEDNLRDVFSQFGIIEELVLMKDQDGVSKGCAFIKFKQKEDALLAIRFLNGNVYIADSDKPIEVRFAESNKKKPSMPIAPIDMMPKPYTITPAMNPVTNPPFYKYMSPEGTAYYWNPHTQKTQWDEPPPGSLVYPENEPPYVVKVSTFQQPKVTSPSGEVKRQGPAGSNLFIFHLPNEWSINNQVILIGLEEEDLYTFFRDFGNIVSCRIMTDRTTGRSRGFGFVSYDNPHSALSAIAKMNGYQTGNKKLKVQLKKGDGEDEAMMSGMPQGTKYNPY